ncbi:MAG: sigma-70 family RNA polymerase sigma factor [Planctomycetales bacterium]|nr:sigma-70 family RNA polymerase sigma factor [Planctomycetales bacterium]
MTSPRAIRLSLIARQLAGQLPENRSTSGQSAERTLRTEEQSEPAVDLLLDEHLDTVYRYALRLTRDAEQAADLAQDTMLRAWRKRGGLREPEKAKVWLLQIANNLWTDQVRRNVHGPQLLDQSPACREAGVAQKMIQQEGLAEALAALDRLPARQRQVMHLITIEQLSHEAVAEVLEISAAAVKASLSIARKQLREQLRELYEEVCGGRRCPTND